MLRRTLDWRRREAKAEAAGAFTKDDLLAFYDRHFSQGSPHFRHLVAHVEGGRATAAAAATAAASAAAEGAAAVARGGGGDGGGAAPAPADADADALAAAAPRFEVDVDAAALDAFKATQPLMAAPAVVRPRVGPRA